MLRILSLFLLLSSCGRLDTKDCILKGDNCEKRRKGEFVAVSEEQKEELSAMRSQISTWAKKCAGGIACGEKDNGEDDDGDSMLWGGLLCLSGDAQQCSAVFKSQGSDGALFRNPKGTRGVNDSSRDMLLGFLSALVPTKNVSAANQAYSYIKSNNFKLCNNATDNRCSVNPSQHRSLWGAMQKVYSYIGAPISSEMNNADLGDETLTSLQSQFAFEGYGLHLVAVEIFIRNSIGNSSSKLQNAALDVSDREPGNPFFELVARGKTSRAAQLTLEKCPKVLNHTRKQWAWQRTDSEQAWLQSKGWECIFMANLLLQE
jgi:hypothetical protein